MTKDIASIISELQTDPIIQKRYLAMLYALQAPKQAVLEKLQDLGIHVRDGMENVMKSILELDKETRESLINEVATGPMFGEGFAGYLIQKLEKYAAN